MELRLTLELAILLMMCALCILSIKGYPFEGNRSQNSSSSESRPERNDEIKMEIELQNQRVEEKL